MKNVVIFLSNVVMLIACVVFMGINVKDINNTLAVSYEYYYDDTIYVLDMNLDFDDSLSAIGEATGYTDDLWSNYTSLNSLSESYLTSTVSENVDTNDCYLLWNSDTEVYVVGGPEGQDASWSNGNAGVPSATVLTKLQSAYADYTLLGFKDLYKEYSTGVVQTTIYTDNYSGLSYYSSSSGYNSTTIYVLQAVWDIAKTYDIILDNADGTQNSQVISVVDSELQTTSVALPQRDGYEFLGYFTQTSGGTQYVDCFGNVDTSIDYNEQIDKLYAHWSPIFSVSFTSASESILYIMQNGTILYQYALKNGASLRLSLESGTYSFMVANSACSVIKFDGVVCNRKDYTFDNAPVNIKIDATIPQNLSNRISI